MAHEIDLDEFLRPNLDREAEIFGEMAQPVERRIAYYRDEWARLEPTLGSEDYDRAEEWFIEEAGPIEMLLDEAAGICLVAIWHWVERRAKTRLFTKERAKGGSGRARRLDFPAITGAFSALNVDVTAMPNYAAIDKLRAFANAWKHEPLEHERARGVFREEEQQKKLTTVAGLPEGAPPGEIVRRFATLALDFLEKLLDS